MTSATNKTIDVFKIQHQVNYSTEDGKQPNISKCTEADIAEEIRLGEMELVAQLVQAEAGNQDLKGKQLVADVVYNRVEDPRFPDTVEEVIYQDRQFSVIRNGSFDRAAWEIDEDSFKASETEYYKKNRKNQNILYFNTVPENGSDAFKCGAHWFSS